MNGKNKTLGWHIAWQDLDQAAFLQILADDKGRQQSQPEAAEHGLGKCLVVIDAQATGDRDRDIAVVALEMPDPLGIHEAVVQTIVLAKILGI